MSAEAEPTSPFPERTVGLEEAARYLGVAPSTLRKRAAAGKVPGYKPGRQWVFLPSELEKYLRASAPPPRREIRIAELRLAVPHERSASGVAREIRAERLALERAQRR
ncbi:MAG: helix-turn-helix domain-containing protein [Steroidobacteraceae bacterium]